MTINYEDLKKEITAQCITRSGKLSTFFGRSAKFDTISKNIINATSFLSENSSWVERVYCIFNNITELPICKQCTNTVTFHHPNKRYNFFCSKSCAGKYNHPASTKPEYVSIKVELPCHADDLLKWISENCFTRVGVSRINNRIQLDSWWKNKNFEDYKTKIIERTSWLDTDNIVERIYHIYHNSKESGKCETCNAPVDFLNFQDGYRQYCSKYCVTQSSSRNEKISLKQSANTNNHPINHSMRIYGCHNMAIPGIIDKIKQTKLSKYGTLNANREKSKETFLKKYGVDHPYKSKEFQQYCRDQKLKKYGTIIPRQTRYSKGEHEVLDFLNSFGYVFKKNRKLLKDKELDGYCKELNLAFEYCGLFWHSEFNKDSKYHYNKYIRCKELGVQLITIFEDEWLHRRPQVEQFLKSKLGIFDKRIFARKTEFRKIIANRDFFDQNHLQGCPKSIKYCYGLFYEDELIGQVSFALHHRKNTILTLNRLAFKDGIQVIGGASKLIKNALNDLNCDVVTWSDNRWSDGNVYKEVGFSESSKLRPDYSYVIPKGINRKSKQSMKKSNIGCPSHITEREFLFRKNIFRIWDCGKIRWEYNKDNGEVT